MVLVVETLHDLELLEKNPETRSAIIELNARLYGITENYSDFVSRITYEIDLIISMLENARDQYSDQREDCITYVICMLLKQKSINAIHGEHSSGSTDLVVRHGQCLWIAESKWWNKNDNALEGMLQLSTRYASGGDNATSGGVLLFNRTGDISGKISRLKEIYKSMQDQFEDITVCKCEASSLAFKTKHKHPASGLEYEVRHRALNFYYDPQDKSGKRTKERRSKKKNDVMR
ncbi:MAG: hypothetical protein D3910_25660 [Candidatus Electrothrix sp. ATG2]|nr:hypothetical protein [Candidatus Electrothrix sp. ATG2]